MNTDDTARLEISTIGESMVVFVPGHGESLEQTASTALYPAGAESNVASYLAQLGHSVGWGGRVGNDPFGRRLLRSFTDLGVDVSQVVIDENRPTGIYFKDPGAEPGIYYYRAGSAGSAMCREDMVSLLARSDRLHVTGITAALGAQTAEMLRTIVGDGRRAGMKVSFDVNYRAPLWSITEAAPVLAELGSLSHSVFVGLDEAQAVWGVRYANDIPQIFPGAEEVIVKDGGIGATAFIGGEEVFETAPKVRVLEPVGAGDAFAAGYLSAAIRGADVSLRLRWGHLLAARVLSAHSDSVLLPEVELLEADAVANRETWAALSF